MARKLVIAVATVLFTLVASSAALACTGQLAFGGPVLGPGDQGPVVGDDFPAGEVEIRWGTSDGPSIGEGTAGDDGSFTATVEIPRDVSGPERIVAVSTVEDTFAPTSAWIDLGADGADAPVVDSSILPRTATVIVAVALLGLAIVLGVRLRRRAAAEGDEEGIAVTEADRAMPDAGDEDRDERHLVGTAADG